MKEYVIYGVKPSSYTLVNEIQNCFKAFVLSYMDNQKTSNFFCGGVDKDSVKFR